MSGFQGSYPKNLQPKNNNSVDVARTTLQQLAPVIQKQYENASAVNGYSSIFYSFLKSGRRCTCRSKNAHGVGSSPAANIELDDKGRASPEVLQSLLQESDTSIMEYGARYNVTEKQTTSKVNVSDVGLVSTNRRVDARQGRTAEDPSAETIIEDDSDTFGFGAEAVDEMLDEDGFDDMIESNVSANSCGICFGSGFINGFEMMNGTKIVLEPKYTKMVLNGFVTDVSKFPYSLLLAGTKGSVVFTLTLPRLVERLETIKVVNRTKPLYGAYTLEIKTVADITWTKLDYKSILNFCTGAPIQIRLTVPQAIFKTFEFTHIDLQLLVSSTPLYMDFPHLNKSSDQAKVLGIEDVQLNLPPRIVSAKPYDLIYDKVTNNLWRIQTADDFIDRIQNQHGIGVSARLVQPYEIYRLVAPQRNLLSVRRTTRLLQGHTVGNQGYSEK